MRHIIRNTTLYFQRAQAQRNMALIGTSASNFHYLTTHYTELHTTSAARRGLHSLMLNTGDLT